MILIFSFKRCYASLGKEIECLEYTEPTVLEAFLQFSYYIIMESVLGIKFQRHWIREGFISSLNNPYLGNTLSDSMGSQYQLTQQMLYCQITKRSIGDNICISGWGL